MGVDQAGDDDTAAEVDDLRAGGRQALADGLDAVAVDEYVDLFGLGTVRSHGDDLRAPQQRTAHASVPVGVRLWWDMMRFSLPTASSAERLCVWW
ncbi:hypothetical protein ACH4MW_35305 [Streptomyces luteogriseus]|uniref:hypothetical protein n=1 Tax=Streptomyces luteogriseus TaxID=68233 RepID=UPI0037A8AF23